MEGAVQEDWLHCIPKDPACKEERVNLTFRYGTHLYLNVLIKLIQYVWGVVRKSSVADPDPGSESFLTPGSGLWDEHLGSYFRELRKKFWVKNI
jgi:hypothetical protein